MDLHWQPLNDLVYIFIHELMFCPVSGLDKAIQFLHLMAPTFHVTDELCTIIDQGDLLRKQIGSISDLMLSLAPLEFPVDS